MAANPTPTTRVISPGCRTFGHVWTCDDCQAAHPDLSPACWQFVNKSGVCPRCTARAESEGEEPNV